MGCGESKHAVATDNTITSKPIKDDSNTNTNAAPETANGIENAPQGEEKGDSNAVTVEDVTQAPVGENEELPSQVENVENGELPSQVKNVKDDEKAEGNKELKEENVDNQETIAEETSSNGDVATEKPKEEDSINQNNEENPKEENIPGENTKEENIPTAEGTVAEESKEDSKAN